MTGRLAVLHKPFSKSELRAWKSRRDGLLRKLPPRLKRILGTKLKARKNPGRRFFGEAYVAATFPCQAAWYGSFKWLTSAKWSGNQKLDDEYQMEFRRALCRHFPRLRTFQGKVAEARKMLGGSKPVAPDLWLITRDKHLFVEVKLPGDKVARSQLLGLALIARYLRGDRPVSVLVVDLYQDRSGRLPKQFQRIAARLRSIKKR